MVSLMDRDIAFVDRIPDSGAIIIVITNEIGRWIAKGITDRRGPAFRRKCVIVAVHQYRQLDRLIGMRGSVMLHHSFVEHARDDIRSRVARLIHGIEVGSKA
jgi:hypothetical protein